MIINSIPISPLKRNLSILLKLLVILVINPVAIAQNAISTNTTIYKNSYALVVGINRYQNLQNLRYAKKDAEALTLFLQQQGFEVTSLYDEQATRTTIIFQMEKKLANRVQRDDRVLFFFAGHGDIKKQGGKEVGYIVPYDGDASNGNYISMEDLQTQFKKMGIAKHQLFILDACYGGLLGMRGVTENVRADLTPPEIIFDKNRGFSPIQNLKIPSYIAALTKRPARQVLTAGGADQQVLDVGPKGHSIFTTYLLEALQEGRADTKDGDGYITFAELCSYLQTKASSIYQTPAYWNLEGHGGGDFVFISPKGASKGDGNKDSTFGQSNHGGKKWLLIGGSGLVAAGITAAVLLNNSKGNDSSDGGFTQPVGRPR